MRGGLRVGVTELTGGARRAGRDNLTDTEALQLCQAIGIRTPVWTFLARGADAAAIDLSLFAGSRIVVKIVAPSITHKSDVGGVVVVPRDVRLVAAAVATLGERAAADGFAGCIVMEYVDHAPAPGAELLLSARWNREFGAVITLGLGGVFANFMGDSLKDDRGPVFWSPEIAGPADIRRAVETSTPGRLATRPFRGSAAPAAVDDLFNVVTRLGDLARHHMPHDLSELEINPLVAGPAGLVAVDALATVAAVPPPRVARPIAKLQHLFEPRHLAVVGVSRDNNPGRIIVTNVIAAGFPRENLFVVKPDCDTVDGCRCVPDLESLPHAVDLCVLSIAAAHIPAALATIVAGELAESVIVIPGGLGEVSGTTDLARAVESLLESSRASHWGGPVVNGGNCLGVRSLPGRYNTLFIPSHKLGFGGTRPAPLAIVAQSGALIAARASRLGDLNPRYLVSLGNQLDLTHGDYLTYLGDDPEVAVFACYAEGFRDGDGLEFLRAARRVTASGRTVLLYRAGRTAAGARASASHTAAIAGDNRVTTALAREAGVIVVDTLDDFEHLTRTACQLCHREFRGMRLGAISNAGYESVAVADNLGAFTLANYGEATRARLAEILQSSALSGIVGIGNPFDVTPIMSDAPFGQSIEAILDDPGVDAVVVGCVPLTGAMNTLAAGAPHSEDVTAPESVGHRIGKALSASVKPAVAVVDAGDAYDSLAHVIAGYGVPCFRTIDTALKVFSSYCASRFRDSRRSTGGA